MSSNEKQKEQFERAYLYIENYYIMPIKKHDKEDDLTDEDDNRGVVIIEIL